MHSTYRLILIFCLIISNSIADVIPEIKKDKNVGLNLSSPDNHFTVPYQGKMKTLMIFVDFENLPGQDNPHTPQQIASKLLGVKNKTLTVKEFFKQQSNNKFDFQIDIDYEWLRIKKKKTDSYPHKIRPVMYIRDALLLAQQKGYSMKDYTVAYVVAPKGMRHNSPTHYISKKELNGVKNPPKVIITFGDDGQQSRIQHLIHETGHAMGLPDLYLFEQVKKNAKFTVPGPWDVMGNNWRATYFSAWSRHIWGWLDNKHKVFFRKGSKDIKLSPIDANMGNTMIVIPSEKFPKEIIVIENPKPWKEGIKNGVLIYKVDASVPSGYGPMKLQLPPGIKTAYEKEALWQPGQKYQNSEAGVTVEILSKIGDSYNIKVSKK